jgi:hypothetical protein
MRCCLGGIAVKAHNSPIHGLIHPTASLTATPASGKKLSKKDAGSRARSVFLVR